MKSGLLHTFWPLTMRFKNARHIRIAPRRVFFAAALCALLLTALPPAQVVAQADSPAQADRTGPVQVIPAADGVHIRWSSGGRTAPADLLEILPQERYLGYDLPMRVIALRLPGVFSPESTAAITPQIMHLRTVDVDPALVAPAPPQEIPLLPDESTPELAPAAAPALPAAPAFVLRSGQMDGVNVAVLAVSPLFFEGGAVRLATELEVFVPGAAPYEASGANVVAAAEYQTVEAPGAREAMAALVDATLNPDATTAIFRLRVANQGIQRVSLAAMQALVPSVTAADIGRVRLSWQGKLIPVQRDADGFRFYAPRPGDRWNSTDTYFVLFSSTNPSPNMASRAVSAMTGSGAPSTVIERGLWQNNRIYESLYAGADGDHWFAADLRSRPLDAPTISARNTVTASLWNSDNVAPFGRLPLVAGSTTFTLTFSPFAANEGISMPSYPLRMSSGGTALHQANVSVLDPGDPAHLRWLPTVSYRFTANTAAATLAVTLLPAAWPAGLKAESLAFARPVQLALNQQGALYAGNPTQTNYRWANAPALPATRLYDLSNPLAPLAVTGANAAGFVDSLEGRTYLLAGEGFLHTPPIETYQPAVFPAGGAQAVYIVPDTSFVAALQPLLALRQSQGYAVAVVDVRTLYDLYSYGQVSPKAIRTFLQQTWVRWNPRPLSAVLVGDGTWDVKNYSGRLLVPRLIPPYMQEGADPYVGETPCDTCFGQLDGVNPHTGDDPNGRFFDTELWIGRFPVKSTAELATVVGKIVQYETAAGSNPLWRSRTLYFADNYWKPQATGTPVRDKAGDFALYSDQMRALNPASYSEAIARRAYFDPYPERNVPSAVGQEWRVPNPNQIGPRVLDEMNSGIALSVYNGHANYFRMGSTEANLPNRDAILIPGDELALQNADRLFVQLSMTCLTSQFAVPDDSAATIDERFFLAPNGGAVAVWGPGGVSVVHGHDKLQRGFFSLLYNTAGKVYRLGELEDAGYKELLLSAPGTEDILRTFLLLGDPLTRLRMPREHSVFLPATKR